MGKFSYDQARSDHGYLWSIGPAYDMTGGYVDQDDLERMLMNPTKVTARKCYESQILYWFQVGPGDNRPTDTAPLIDADPKLAEIAERYGII